MTRLVICSTLAVLFMCEADAIVSGRTNAPQELQHREFPPLGRHIDMVVFSPDGKLMAAGADSVVHVWSVPDCKTVTRMQLPSKQIYHRIAFMDGGKKLIWTGREDDNMRIFDVKTGRQLHEYPRPRRNSGPFTFRAFSHDGRLAAFKGPQAFRGLTLMDTATGNITLTIEDVEDCRGCAFSPDGKVIAVHSMRGQVRLLDAATGKLVRELHPPTLTSGAHGFAAFSPDGSLLATCGHMHNSIRVWEVETGKLAWEIKNKFYYSSAQFSLDNQTLLCLPADGRAVLYNLFAEKAVHWFNPPDRHAVFAGFSPDNKYAAIAGYETKRRGGNEPRRVTVHFHTLTKNVLNPAVANVDEFPLEKLFNELGSNNRFRLGRIMDAFVAAPKKTVQVFRQKCPPVPAGRQKQIEKWLLHLNDESFSKREEAMKRVRAGGHQFTPLLAAVQAQAGPGEIRNRVTLVLDRINQQPLPAELIVQQRVLKILERINTPDARKCLAELAGGAGSARLSIDAQAALDRLENQK